VNLGATLRMTLHRD